MNDTEDPKNAGRYEQFLARTFQVWREEFRKILEDHRREIQVRLERIEREIEQKSDKENVDLLVRGIREELQRHARDISQLESAIATKMGSETMWKIVGLMLTIITVVGGIIGFIVHLLGKIK